MTGFNSPFSNAQIKSNDYDNLSTAFSHDQSKRLVMESKEIERKCNNNAQVFILALYLLHPLAINSLVIFAAA